MEKKDRLQQVDKIMEIITTVKSFIEHAMIIIFLDLASPALPTSSSFLQKSVSLKQYFMLN
jgi:hypothetical protein